VFGFLSFGGLEGAASLEGISVTLILVLIVVIFAKVIGGSAPSDQGFTLSVFAPASGISLSAIAVASTRTPSPNCTGWRGRVRGRVVARPRSSGRSGRSSGSAGRARTRCRCRPVGIRGPVRSGRSSTGSSWMRARRRASSGGGTCTRDRDRSDADVYITAAMQGAGRVDPVKGHGGRRPAPWNAPGRVTTGRSADVFPNDGTPHASLSDLRSAIGPAQMGFRRAG
jgi:hypothetical protein